MHVYNYFISSEIHSVNACQDAAFILFRSLSENYNVKDILMEIPYSFSFLINMFFQTGDSSYIMSEKCWRGWQNLSHILKKTMDR